MNEERKKYILQTVSELLKVKESDGRIVDVVSLASFLGFKVLKLKNDANVNGLIYVKDSGLSVNEKPIRIIAYKTSLSEKENRFIIAHELGHFYLHSNVESFISDGAFVYAYHFDEKSKASDYEEEADFFAANLLIPEEDFKKQYQKYGVLSGSQLAIDGLSNYYNVSTNCIKKRIKELEL